MEANCKRPQFGNRFLQDEKEIFKHNAWDNVQWNEEQEQHAREKVLENSEIILPESDILKLEETAFNQWNTFYGIHQNRFFKDRHWLFTEFSELAPKYSADNKTSEVEDEDKYYEIENSASTSKPVATNIESLEVSTNLKNEQRCIELREGEKYPGENSTTRIFEVGCGVGNTVFPILETNNDPELFIYCCDFSENAINIVKLSENYDLNRCNAFVYDLTCNEGSVPFPDDSLDIIICIFVLSALQPSKMENALKRLAKFLKPGGILLFRDYGRYDMAQLRFKKGRCLGENFYARGDGTLCYFFTQEDVRKLMISAGLNEVQNVVDRRLQVNRGKQLTMYRVWIQARYQKPMQSS